MIEDEDSIIFQQIDIREKYAVGKHPEFMMYGVTQVKLFTHLAQFGRFGDANFRTFCRTATAFWHMLLDFSLTSMWLSREASKKKTLGLSKPILMYFTHLTPLFGCP